MTKDEASLGREPEKSNPTGTQLKRKYVKIRKKTDKEAKNRREDNEKGLENRIETSSV